MINDCLYCPGDRKKDNAMVLARLCLKHHLVSEEATPAGRALEFEEKGRVFLSAICNECDEIHLRLFLGELSE